MRLANTYWCYSLNTTCSNTILARRAKWALGHTAWRCVSSYWAIVTCAIRSNKTGTILSWATYCANAVSPCWCKLSSRTLIAGHHSIWSRVKSRWACLTCAVSWSAWDQSGVARWARYTLIRWCCSTCHRPNCVSVSTNHRHETDSLNLQRA